MAAFERICSGIPDMGKNGYNCSGGSDCVLSYAICKKDKCGTFDRSGELENKGQNKHMLLIVPGRIGTSLPELGVPTTFADISEFEAICEIEEKNAGYNPELSYGSHIFQDLVEAEILYTAVFSNEKTLHFVPEKLAEYPDIVSQFTEDPELRQIVHVYDVSRGSCELCNDLQRERLMLYLI